MSGDISDTINQAAGFQPADFLIKNTKILNLATGDTDLRDIAISRKTGMIVGTGQPGWTSGMETLDLEGKLYVLPGFIDCHVHIESSMVTPQVFDEAVLMRGTTTAFCDPHEMSNVLGESALRYFIECSENMTMDLMVGLSSCVPATSLETSGARLGAQILARYIDNPRVYGVAEFMSIGDVLDHDPATLGKLETFENRHICGHMPYGVTSGMMNAMKACGIRNCHENTDLAHALEKLALGIQVFIREGSVCKDARTLAPIVNRFTSPFLGLCTDDRNPLDIASEGHIDHVIRTLIAAGADVASVYRMATWSAASHFGIASRNIKGWKPRGLIAPDNLADLVLIEDLERCTIHSVYKAGEKVTPEMFARRRKITPVGYGSIKIGDIEAKDLVLSNRPPDVDVIGLIRDQIVTTHERASVPVGPDGALMADPANDLLHVAVIERHGKNGNISRGFVRGFGIREGAMAVSVGHDSHNITVVGANPEDMAVAVRRIAELQGGKVVVRNGEVLGQMALPVAGLMSDKTDLREIGREQADLKQAAAKLGSAWNDPIMMLCFLPLCVIPDAKITDFGITRFNPAAGILKPTLIDDQRKEPR